MLNDFQNAGRLVNKYPLSDQELKEVIYHQAQVITFLNARGDCAIIVPILRHELTKFMKWEAEREKNK